MPLRWYGRGRSSRPSDALPRCSVRQAVTTGGGWVCHSVGGVLEAYLDLSSAQVAWQPPDRHSLSRHLLDQATLQVRGV